MVAPKFVQNTSSSNTFLLLYLAVALSNKMKKKNSVDSCVCKAPPLDNALR